MPAQLFDRPAATASPVLDPPRQEWQPALQVVGQLTDGVQSVTAGSGVS